MILLLILFIYVMLSILLLLSSSYYIKNNNKYTNIHYNIRNINNNNNNDNNNKLYMSAGDGGVVLERLVARKKKEVDLLLRKHQEPDDPLVMRLSYVASECKYNLTRSLKRDGYGKDNFHTMSILVDVKRKSPTVPHNRNIVEFSSAAKFTELLTLANADAFLINTDEIEYGGQFSDLKDSIQATRLIKPNNPPACIHKDIIIHPVQIAQALEQGAAGVLLIVSIVGSDLEVLLDACTIMGTEALVEVHTPNELEYALKCGATLFLCNMWDRVTGRLYPEQAKGIAHLMPINAVAIAAGNIHTMSQVTELGFYGYDGVVLGRGILELPDIKGFIDEVHSFTGPPRGTGMPMKGLPWQ